MRYSQADIQYTPGPWPRGSGPPRGKFSPAADLSRAGTLHRLAESVILLTAVAGLARQGKRSCKKKWILGGTPWEPGFLLNPTAVEAKDVAERLEMSTAEIGLSVRTTNCLEERGIYTVNDLLNSTADDLLSISNFGEKTLEEVYKALEGIGFYRRSRRRAKSGATKSSRRLGNRGDWPWRAVSDSTRRNAATGGPVPGCWAASAKPSSSPSSSSGAAPGWWWPSSPWWCPSGGSTTTSSRTPAPCWTNASARDRGDSGLCRPEVHIHYTVAGTPYDTLGLRHPSRLLRQPPGGRGRHRRALSRASSIACWYDPARPEVAVLVRGYMGGTGWC